MFNRPLHSWRNRSIHQRCSIEKGVLRNLAKFTRKHLCQSLFFNKVAGLRLWHMCFPVNFAKFLRTPFLLNTSGRLLLEKLKTGKTIFRQKICCFSKSNDLLHLQFRFIFIFNYQKGIFSPDKMGGETYDLL